MESNKTSEKTELLCAGETHPSHRILLEDILVFQLWFYTKCVQVIKYIEKSLSKKKKNPLSHWAKAKVGSTECSSLMFILLVMF